MHASYHCFVYWLIVPQFMFYIFEVYILYICRSQYEYRQNIQYKHICICTHSSPLYTIKVDCCISNRSQYDRRHITQIALYSVLVPWLYTGETETNGMINDTPTYHDVPTYRVPTYPYPLPSIGRWSHQFDCYISNRFQYNRCAGDSCHGRTEKTNDARFMTYQLMGTTYIPLRFPPSGVVPVNWRRNNTTYNMTVWRYGAYNTTDHEGIY